MKLIKKYKNRRLYDTEISRYITLEDVQDYVLKDIPFRIEESPLAKNVTHSVLLQIILEMEEGSTQFLSEGVLRQLIGFAHHPLHRSFQSMMEQMVQAMGQYTQQPYQKATDTWKQMMQQWQDIFKQ